MWSVAFSLSTIGPSCAILWSRVAKWLPGILWLFTYLGSRVAKWLPLRKASANGRSGVCSLLSLVPDAAS
jgi:hypothetical protein